MANYTLNPLREVESSLLKAMHLPSVYIQALLSFIGLPNHLQPSPTLLSLRASCRIRYSLTLLPKRLANKKLWQN